jgi:hypothetical protein
VASNDHSDGSTAGHAVLGRVILILALGCALVVPARSDARAAAPPGWKTRFVDRTTDADSYSGTRTYIQTAPSGISTILYCDGPLGGGRFDLKLARGPMPDGTFDMEVIDPNDPQVIGQGSLAVDSKRRPHVSYVSGLFYGQGVLKYARRQASTWRIEPVDANQGVDDTAIAVDSKDHPLIAYGTLSDELRLATRERDAWVSDVVSLESVEALDLVLDSENRPRIAYVAWDGSAYVLRLATSNGTSWSFETISHVSSQGIEFGVDLMLDSSDRPQIVFAVLEPVRGLSFARYTSNGWEVELIRDGDLWQPTAVLDPGDTVHLVFYDATIGALMYGQRAPGGSWLLQTIEDDPSPNVRIGRQPSIALDPTGRAHVSYYFGDAFMGAALKYAESTPV